MGSSQKIIKGIGWTTFLNVVNGIYGFISVPILIAYFGKSNYGLIGLAVSINVYLRLMDMGMNSVNVRFFSNWIEKKNYDKVNKLFKTSLTFYGIIGLINALILIVVSVFSKSIFHLNSEQDVIIKHLLYILSISAFINWFTACFDQFIRANEFVGWTQKITLLPKLLQIIILVYTVTIGLSIEWYYALTAFSMFVIIPFCIFKIKRISPYVIFSIGFDFATLKEILPYSLNIFSFSMFQFSVSHLRPVILGIQGTVESVADFRVLNGIISIVMMIGGSFLGVILPSASRVVARGDKQAQDRVAYDGTKYITMTLAFCCFGVVSISRELLLLYVGDGFLYLLPWLILWLLITMLSHNQAISGLILAGSDIRAITYCTLVSSIIGLILCWFLVPLYAVGGTVIGYGVYCLIQILFFYLYYWPNKLNIDSKKVFFKSFFPSTLVGAVISFAIFKIPIDLPCIYVFLIKGILFAILYGFSVLAILNEKDKRFLIEIIKHK